MKKQLSILMLFVLLFSAPAWAGGKYGKCGKEMDLDEKFYMVSSIAVKNAEELGLSEEQKEAVKENKYALKKDLVRKKAEIELVCIDISSELWKDTVNAEAVNALVDRKYQLKAEKKKAIVNAYAGLMNSLSKEQKDSIKSLCGMERAMKCRCGCQAQGCKAESPKPEKKK
ncbi:MAG TPA: hypothetical protein PKZ41_02865 [Candidatus Omnitrophota bacterium]|nr:hypothetical protein [Candidatus Omnitrophota bacterium]